MKRRVNRDAIIHALGQEIASMGKKAIGELIERGMTQTDAVRFVELIGMERNETQESANYYY